MNYLEKLGAKIKLVWRIIIKQWFVIPRLRNYERHWENTQKQRRLLHIHQGTSKRRGSEAA